MTTDINAQIGWATTGRAAAMCADCKQTIDNSKLNYEAVQRLGALWVVCIDRAACKRRMRKRLD